MKKQFPAQKISCINRKNQILRVIDIKGKDFFVEDFEYRKEKENENHCIDKRN